MNKKSIYTQLASIAEKDSDYAHYKYTLIEKIIAHWGLEYEESGTPRDIHEKNLKILKDYIMNKATYAQLSWLEKNIIYPTTFKNDYSNLVFIGVVMNEDKLKNCQKIQTTIQEAVLARGSRYYVSNENNIIGNINEQIFKNIEGCCYAIFDFTSQNEGVYLEAGYALGLGKTVLFTCQEEDFKNVHFDINHIRFILWKDTDDLKEKLKKTILENHLEGN